MAADLATWLSGVLTDRARGPRETVPSYRGVTAEGRAERGAGDIWRDSVLALAEIETKLRIVELHRGAHACRTEEPVIGAAAAPSEWSRRSVQHSHGPCLTLRLLAAPFRGWPGWRDEWSA